MKESLIKNLSQLFLIVFSVVLGIFLSERLEEQKNKNEATKLLSKITAEINDNSALLADWAPYHAEIAQKMNSLSNDEEFIERFINDKTVLYREVLNRGTFMSAMPSSDAWDIAKAHPLIVNFDYDELLILSRIYNQQEITFEPVGKIFEVFYSPDFNTSTHAQANLQQFNNRMQEIASREAQLISFYNAAAEIFDLPINQE